MEVSFKHFISCENDVIISQDRGVDKTLFSHSFINLQIFDKVNIRDALNKTIMLRNSASELSSRIPSVRGN
jgi:hypothetical protein